MNRPSIKLYRGTVRVPDGDHHRGVAVLVQGCTINEAWARLADEARDVGKHAVRIGIRPA